MEQEPSSAESTHDSGSQAARVRDEDYYFDDGDVVLVVETSLFKVHKFLFMRSSAFFRDLLALPQGSSSQEGLSDDDPITCHDTLEDFRALCWVLYASPKKIWAQRDLEGTDATNLVALAGITHKYDCTELRDWALDVLEGHSAKDPQKCVSKIAEWARLRRILVLATQCNRIKFARSLEDEWLRRIQGAENGALVSALDAAESCAELRSFHGRAYHAYLKSCNFFDFRKTPKISDPITFDEIGGCTDEIFMTLSDQRKSRLMQGFWSLSVLRPRLSRPPKMEDNPTCSKHTNSCAEAWESWWNSGVIANVERKGKSLSDPGTMMEEILKKAKSVPQGGHWLPRGPPCDASMRAQAEKLAERFFETLPDRFGIP
ncbi:hypothetical protein NP233_g6733 [Leucocoprinus birnbaumii]|uniref:BTB domain-containing protein n=1 Tax=Leucocoprinus birnbaumii TaxID=56174 RepID=A0AAD5VTB1_9AGAR|nr:hypothetical protein NP233_g6733 [Leucocoprinus birnbaumii]